MVKFGIIGLATFAAIMLINQFFPGALGGAVTVNNHAVQWLWIAGAGIAGAFYKLA